MFHGKHLNLTYCLNENYVNVAKYTIYDRNVVGEGVRRRVREGGGVTVNVRGNNKERKGMMEIGRY